MGKNKQTGGVVTSPIAEKQELINLGEMSAAV